MNYYHLLNQLKEHEGFRAHPYKDTVGKWTIGYGRNLDDVGISQEEAEQLLRNDINTAILAVKMLVPRFNNMTDIRKEVLVNMVFNMGPTRLAGFRKMLAAIEEEEWGKAAEEMLDSQWALQVKRRAHELAFAMQENRWPDVNPPRNSSL